MYTISYSKDVREDLKRLKARDRTTLLDRIEQQLTHEPTKPTRNRKQLVGLIPPWDAEGIVWELRIGDWRAYYDVDEVGFCVVIRAIRQKPPHLTTDQSL